MDVLLSLHQGLSLVLPVRPGIISPLLEAHIDGRPLTKEELLGFCGQLFIRINAEITPFLGNSVPFSIEEHYTTIS